MNESQIKLVKSLAKDLGKQKPTRTSAYESLRAANIITEKGNFRPCYKSLRSKAKR